MKKLSVTVNYQDDEKEFTFDFVSEEALVETIKEVIKREKEATSFVFVVSR